MQNEAPDSPRTLNTDRFAVFFSFPRDIVHDLPVYRIIVLQKWVPELRLYNTRSVYAAQETAAFLIEQTCFKWLRLSKDELNRESGNNFRRLH